MKRKNALYCCLKCAIAYSYIRHPSLLEKRKLKQIENFQNPDYVKKSRDSLSKVYATKEFKIKKSKASAKGWSKEAKEKISKKMKDSYATGARPTPNTYPTYFMKDYEWIKMNGRYEYWMAEILTRAHIEWEYIGDGKIGLPWIDSENKSRTYYPDFFLPHLNVFIDPKGTRFMEEQKEKLDFAPKQNGAILFYGRPDSILKEIVRFTEDESFYKLANSFEYSE